VTVAFPILLTLLVLEQSTPPAAPTSAADQALDLVGGSWTCTSFHGEQKVESFESSAPDIISESNAGAGDVDDAANERRYTFDSTKGTWLLSLPGAGGTLTALPWTRARWIFEGAQKGQRLRITFTSYGPPAFRRDVEAFSGGRWTELSGQTCKRLSR
jgi:hypothetical protein